MATSLLNIPVLMYHRVNSAVIDYETVHLDKFKEHLEYLNANGYHTITLSQYQNYLDGQWIMPDKPLLLTFDDGYVDNYTNVLPLLKQYGMKATLFVIAGQVGGACTWLREHESNHLMNWEQLSQWLAAGMEIGSHTMNHARLSSCTEAQVRYELAASKEMLEQKLNTKIDFFCYPYGDFDNRVKAIVKEIGYKGSFAILNNVSFSDVDLYAIPRIGIPSFLPLWRFKLKVSKLHRSYISLRILQSKVRNMRK